MKKEANCDERVGGDHGRVMDLGYDVDDITLKLVEHLCGKKKKGPERDVAQRRQEDKPDGG